MKKEKKDVDNKNGTNAKDVEQQKENDREHSIKKSTSKVVHTIIHEVTYPKIKIKKNGI